MRSFLNIFDDKAVKNIRKLKFKSCLVYFSPHIPKKFPLCGIATPLAYEFFSEISLEGLRVTSS